MMGEVWRGGVIASGISQQKESVKYKERYISIPRRPHIYCGGRHGKGQEKGVVVSCTIASKGGGETSVILWLEKSDFINLAESMMKADPDEAKKAFSSAVENPNATHERWMREYHEEELANLSANGSQSDDSK